MRFWGCLQVGAVAPQSLDNLLPSIHDCLGSPDWATRKAAADVLISLALHSSNLVTDRAAPTVTVLESCRFDKVVFCYMISYIDFPILLFFSVCIDDYLILMETRLYHCTVDPLLNVDSAYNSLIK